LSKRLLNAEWFGEALAKDNNWLGDVEKPLLAGAKTDVEKAARIYAYVRDNFTCTDHSSLGLDQSIKAVAKTKNGNDAEINILLTAMLKYADIKADPVILSTRSHGVTYALYSLLNRFNYVVSRAVINNKEYYFDASVPRLGFGKLMPYCYNGHARIVNEDATPVFLSPDSLMERKISSVFLITDEQGQTKGTMQQTMGYNESLEVREQVKEKGQDDFIKSIQKVYGEEIKIENPAIDSINKTEEPLLVKYDIVMKGSDEDIIYFNPMFGEGYKKNPFKSAERFYPVEMPYTSDETYILNMEVPKGYVVDELPKSVRLKLNEQGDGMFEYMIQQQDDRISLRSRILLKRTTFLPEEYDLLREFFNLLVKKQNEQIVFKKKK
ncbi:MAG: transglutaminase-like domain-containing protein, partial [Bacteroidota bacterium]